MPYLPGGPCSNHGCAARAVNRGLCREHAQERQARYDATRGNATERGYGSAWRAIRSAYLEAYPICVGCRASATEVDHIQAKREGGSDEWANLRAFCKPCHSRRTASEQSWPIRRAQ